MMNVAIIKVIKPERRYILKSLELVETINSDEIVWDS